MTVDLTQDERPTDAGLVVDLIRAVACGQFVASREEAIELLESAFLVHSTAGESKGMREAFDRADASSRRK
jgi:hypothetical protein